MIDRGFELVCILGSNGFSFEALAADTGITRRTIYRHFETKTALIEAVVKHQMAKFDDLALSGVAQTDPLGALRELAYWHFDCQHQPKMFALANFLAFECQANPVMAEKRQEWFEQNCRRIRELIETAQQTGLLRNAPAEDLLALLLDMIAGSIFRFRSGMKDSEIFGSVTPEAYFSRRWAMFLYLARPGPWDEECTHARPAV